MSCDRLARAGDRYLPVVAEARDSYTAILMMAAEFSKRCYLELTGVWLPKRYRVRRVAAIFLAISTPVPCALLEHSEFIREHGEDIPEIRNWRRDQ